MKIYSTTFHCAINYGAVLQCYSLLRYLQDQGHDARVLDYWPPHRVAQNSIWPQRKPGLMTMAMQALVRLNRRQLTQKLDKFAAFRRDYLPCSEQRYASLDEIKANPPASDAYITGSDQVWNPADGVDPVYYLAFASSVERKISYAASIGLPNLTPQQVAEMAPLIARFDALSSREHRGSELIEQMTSRNAQTVVDPVFLQTKAEWERILPPTEPPKQKYILVYAVRRRKTLEAEVRRIKKQTGWPVILIPGTNPLARGLIPADQVAWNAGPLDFLRLIQQAGCVVTNSFHGTAFSLIFDRPFVSVSHTKGDSRVSSILHRCGQERRLLRPGDPPVDIFSVSQTDWSQLTSEIDRSKAYLAQALSGRP